MYPFYRSPCCRIPLEQDEEGLCCEACGAIYQIRDGIPVLLLHEARQRCQHCGLVKQRTELLAGTCKDCGSTAMDEPS